MSVRMSTIAAAIFGLRLCENEEEIKSDLSQKQCMSHLVNDLSGDSWVGGRGGLNIPPAILQAHILLLNLN